MDAEKTEAHMQNRTQPLRRQRGTSMLTTLFALGALLAAGAFAIDTGAIWVARTQLQAAVDAAALAAAQSMIDVNGSTVSVALGTARKEAKKLGEENSAFDTAEVKIQDADIEFGEWHFATFSGSDNRRGTLDTSVDQDDPDKITGVRVRARLADGAANNPIPALLGRVLGLSGSTGHDSYNISAEATAYVGWEGGADASQIVIPIALDCCLMGPGACDEGYCSQDNPITPNACELDKPQGGDSINTVSCIIAQPTTDQVGCWTELSTTDQATNASGVRDVIEQGGAEVSTNDAIYVSNGTKTSAFMKLQEKFNAEGENRYPAGPEGDSDPDSWVKAMPVIECQAHELKLDHCAKSTPKQVVGFACIEIREIIPTPDHVVRGRFLCPNNDVDRQLIEDGCDLADDPGGGNFGIRVTRPVLVD